jgi:4-diphosphocytidyl-2-C-methyl-D-erythritol kinase
MIIFPTCKINLGLHVLEKREDNFHNIESVFVEVPFCDVLEVIESDQETFSISGLQIEGESNIVLQAKSLFQKHFDIPKLSIHLHKSIPMGAGLGGGSSDAAFLLKLLRNKYHTEVTNAELKNLAQQLGSDCAFFIEGGTQLAKKRGELLSKMHNQLSNYYLMLVNCGVHISTKEAFSGIVPKASRKSVEDIIIQPIESWKDELTNDFEHSAFNKYPILGEIKTKLYHNGAVYASMTGSGSTIYGVFNAKPKKIEWNLPSIFVQTIQL